MTNYRQTQENIFCDLRIMANLRLIVISGYLIDQNDSS